jgi:hypothetical protein
MTDKGNMNQIPTEELNGRLEKEFQKKTHPKSAVIKTFGLVIIGLGLLFIPAKNENGLSFGAPFLCLALFCFACAGLIDKRVTMRGGRVIHKAAHPVAFWFVIIMEIIGALLAIAYIISKGFN